MAKDDQVDKKPATAPAADPPAPAEPFVETSPTALAAPTEAQHAWMLANPRYVRMAHSNGRFANRGTLRPDGSFVSEIHTPVADGGGNFGVGIPQ